MSEGKATEAIERQLLNLRTAKTERECLAAGFISDLRQQITALITENERLKSGGLIKYKTTDTLVADIQQQRPGFVPAFTVKADEQNEQEDFPEQPDIADNGDKYIHGRNVGQAEPDCKLCVWGNNAGECMRADGRCVNLESFRPKAGQEPDCGDREHCGIVGRKACQQCHGRNNFKPKAGGGK